MQQDPIGFDAGDTNVYRYVSNTPIALLDPSRMDDIRIEKDRKGAGGGFFFEMRGGTLSGNLKNSEFKVGSTNIKIQAYSGDSISIKTSAVPTGGSVGKGVTIVALSDCADDFKWLQFVKRSLTIRAGEKQPGGGKMDIQKPEGNIVYAEPDKWRVD